MTKLTSIDGGKALQDNILSSVLRTLNVEANGLAALRSSILEDLGHDVAEAVELIKTSTGRVIVAGIGKSGHIGQKIAATFASTGTPSFFVHPTEAAHGDLGMITSDDVILAISWSGETAELKGIITYAGRFKVAMIAITSNRKSALGAQADIVLELPKADEACPHGLAPTTSTTMQLALGDCLAVALLEAKGFTAQDFKAFHPGGSLGASLKYVSDIMHTADAMPLVARDAIMSEALVMMTSKSFGCVGIVDADGKLIGVVTDGDLRRHMDGDLLGTKAEAIMTPAPKTAPPTLLASAALELMNSARITSLFIVDDDKPTGIVHVHDFLRAGVV